jgi:hypothetical protein
MEYFSAPKIAPICGEIFSLKMARSLSFRAISKPLSPASPNKIDND